MGINRIAVPASPTRRVEKLKGRLYTTSANRPCPTLVAYHWDPQQPEKGRYVITDGQLQGSRLQPYVHDTRVRVRWNGTVYTFLVLYKRHRYLPVNGSTPDISNAGFRGDALVVAEGPLVGARGMGGRETRAADYTMKRFAAFIGTMQNQRRMPLEIDFISGEVRF